MTVTAEDLTLSFAESDDSSKDVADLADENPADSSSEPAAAAPIPKKKKPNRRKKNPGGLAGQRPLVRPPITVGRHLSDGRSYGWVKTYPVTIPDEATLFRDLGPGRFRLQCPSGGLQYVEIHPSAAQRPSPPPSPTTQPTTQTAEPAPFEGDPRARAPLVLLARILAIAGRVLDQVQSNGRAIEAMARRPPGRQYGPPTNQAPEHAAPYPPPQQHGPVWNPYTNQWAGGGYEPEPEPETALDKLRDFAELKYLFDEMAGMFGNSGGGDADDDGGEYGWMKSAAEQVFRRFAGPGAPPQQPPPYAYQPQAQAAPAPAGWPQPPQPAPAPPAPTPSRPPPPSTLPGMTEEIAGELAQLAPALGLDWASMMALATQFGWDAPTALAAARQRAGEQ